MLQCRTILLRHGRSGTLMLIPWILLAVLQTIGILFIYRGERQGNRILTLGGLINRHSRESGNPYRLLPGS